MNIFTKIFRFFFPKGGFKENLNKGKEVGKTIGMQAGEEVNKTLDKINIKKQ
jgi:hypothetical protein